MLALLSRHSLEKPNPSKERQLGLAIAKERNEDFLIPLNLDDLKPTEIGWELSDVNWIPFSNWATGLGRLEKLLAHVGTPKALGSNGLSAAISTYNQDQFLEAEPELLVSNCYEVRELPRQLGVYRASRPLASVERYQLGLRWPFYTLAGDKFAALRPPVVSPEVPYLLSEMRTEPLHLESDIEGVHVVRSGNGDAHPRAARDDGRRMGAASGRR
jgi:hypothetical protein